MTLDSKTFFIANRGEIADRINRAAKAQGLRPVQTHSETDGHAGRPARRRGGQHRATRGRRERGVR